MILGIYGSGGLAREVCDLAQEINKRAEQWEKIVIVADFKKEATKNGVDIFTFNEFKAKFDTNNARLVIAVGEPKVRQSLREEVIASGYTLQTLIHPTAFVGAETKLGDGVIIQFGCFISCNVEIGDSVVVQPNATVGHDSIVGQDSVISSFVAISGTCKIGERAYLGINVPVREITSIGNDSIVGMGSVVVRDIPANVVALGNPARAMKSNENGVFH